MSAVDSCWVEIDSDDYEYFAYYDDFDESEVEWHYIDADAIEDEDDVTIIEWVWLDDNGVETPCEEYNEYVMTEDDHDYYV